MRINVCNYVPIRQPFDVRGINLRFQELFKQVCFLAGGGSVGSQDLASVLTIGNTSADPILLTGTSAKVLVSDAAGDNITTVDPDGITIQNPGGFTGRITGDLLTGNYIAQLQGGKSGIIAYLSDIPLGGPMTVNTQSGDYTLQPVDCDNNTLVEIDNFSDSIITIDDVVLDLTTCPIGTSIMLGRYGIGGVQVVGAGSIVILTPNGVSAILTYQNSIALLERRSATEFYLSGDIGQATSSPLTATYVGVGDVGNNLNGSSDLTWDSGVLQVTGKVKIVDGSEADGFVLTAIGDGTGKWVDPLIRIDTIFVEGTYVPTFSSQTNITLVNINTGPFTYSKNYKNVTVRGLLNIQTTVTNTETLFRMTLPVALTGSSTFINNAEAAGSLICVNGVGGSPSGGIYAATSDSKVICDFISGFVGSPGIYVVHFTYTL